MALAKKNLYEKAKQPEKDNTDVLINQLTHRIESLKTEYNLFFAGEIRVPPEKEREELEKKVRELLFNPLKSSRNQLLVQNLSSQFTVYNNLWKKKLSEIESGMVVIKKKRIAFMEDQKPAKKKEIALDISLNREESFDTFYENYAKIMKKGADDEAQKERVINSLKTTLITKNLIDAKVSLSVSEGKLKLKIKQE